MSFRCPLQALELLLSKLPAHSQASAAQLALTAAAARGSLVCARALLRRKDVGAHRQDEDGRLPLVEAAVAGHLAVANLLLERGARPADADSAGGSAFSVV